MPLDDVRLGLEPLGHIGNSHPHPRAAWPLNRRREHEAPIPSDGPRPFVLRDGVQSSWRRLLRCTHLEPGWTSRSHFSTGRRSLPSARRTISRIIEETASSGGFILHSAVEEFERKLASYLGVKHAIGISDCTNAMLLGTSRFGREDRRRDHPASACASSPQLSRSISRARSRFRSSSTSETAG